MSESKYLCVITVEIKYRLYQITELNIVHHLPETRDSLVAQVQDPSNQLAWEEFVQIYRPVVYRIAVARGLQHADALDLVQTVFISVANSIGRWEKKNPSSRFRHWLLRIAKNATINAITRRPLDQPLAGSTAETLIREVPQSDCETGSLIELEYRRELYLNAAEKVRVDVHPDTWKAFQLTAIDGMSNAAAANELGKSVGTVYAARSRIMKRLTNIVAEIESSYQ